MANLRSIRSMTGAAAAYATPFADIEDLAALASVTKLASMHPAFVNVDGRINEVLNLANAADPFTNNVAGRGPAFTVDPLLGRQTAVFDAAQDDFLATAQPFNWSGAWTVAAVGRVTEVPGDIFQNVVGDFSSTAADAAGIIAQSSGGVNRLTNRSGTIPGGASYARAEYVGGALFYAVASSDGLSRTAFRLNKGAFDRQDMNALPSVGTTDFRIGHNIANSSMEGAVDFVIGVQGEDWSQPAHAASLALLDAYVMIAYGAI